MAGAEAHKGDTAAAFVLPPYRPSFLARYSRKSKLTAVNLALLSLIAVGYIIWTLAPTAEEFALEVIHKPHVHGAQTEEKLMQPRLLSADSVHKDGAPNDTGLNQQNANVSMVVAPDPGLIENTSVGDLPRTGEDGRMPWQVYARPFNAADQRPRLALVIAGLGLDPMATEAVLTHMPASVTLAFDVNSSRISSWCDAARNAGHETLLSLPMEPFDYPHSDPGPHSLLTSLPNTGNIERLDWALAQATGYVGVTTLSGTRFVTEDEKVRPILQELQQRGLLVLDARIAVHSAIPDLAKEMHFPSASAVVHIDDNISPEEIDAALQRLEQVARLNGKAVGVVTPLPLVMERVQAWLKALPGDGVALAPVSAIAQ